jgi:MBG domain (YGX type)
VGDVGIGSNDSGDLRYCINQANANDQANTIVFDSTVFPTQQTITLSRSQLELEDTGGTQTITGPAAGGEQVGDYAITQGTLAADSNYTMSFTASTLAITPPTLTITADPETKVFGSADPTLAYTTSGFQFSDTGAAVLTGQLARAAGQTVAGLGGTWSCPRPRRGNIFIGR